MAATIAEDEPIRYEPLLASGGDPVERMKQAKERMADRQLLKKNMNIAEEVRRSKARRKYYWSMLSDATRKSTKDYILDAIEEAVHNEMWSMHRIHAEAEVTRKFHAMLERLATRENVVTATVTARCEK